MGLIKPFINGFTNDQDVQMDTKDESSSVLMIVFIQMDRWSDS